MTQKLPRPKCVEINKNKTSEPDEREVSPKLSIDKKVDTKPEEKTDNMEVFHDASESINPNEDENNDLKIDSSKTNSKVENPTESNDDLLTSTEVAKNEKHTTSVVSTSDKNEDGDESFTEKANEEVMEKDLPDKKEENE